MIKKHKTGHWISVDYFAVCSACNGEVNLGCDTKTQAQKRAAEFHNEYRFCPFCGVKMEEN